MTHRSELYAKAKANGWSKIWNKSTTIELKEFLDKIALSVFKTCKCCKINMNITNFYRMNERGYHTSCKKCYNEKIKKKYAEKNKNNKKEILTDEEKKFIIKNITKMSKNKISLQLKHSRFWLSRLINRHTKKPIHKLFENGLIPKYVHVTIAKSYVKIPKHLHKKRSGRPKGTTKKSRIVSSV